MEDIFTAPSKPEGTQSSAEENTPIHVDEDFMYIQELMNVPNAEWDCTKDTENMKLYKRKSMKGSEVMIKTIVKLPGIPK